MTPPSVLLDATFLAAVLDPDHDDASPVGESYLELLDDYQHHRIRLRARRDHLAQVPSGIRRALLSPVHGIHVAAQHRRAATRLVPPVAMSEDDRITLVVMRRERIDRIATLSPVFAALDVRLHPAPEPLA